MLIGMSLMCLLTPVILALRCLQGNNVGVQSVQRMVMQAFFLNIISIELGSNGAQGGFIT